MTPSSTVLATSRGGDHSPLAIHSVVSSRKKAPKRKKLHASKQSRTTFIVADVANFSQMVQHVTGMKFGDSTVMSEALLGAEAQRESCRGRSCNDVRTSCRNDARRSMSAGFSPAAMLDMRMFPELQQAAAMRFGLPPAVVSDGGVGSMFDWATTFHTLQSGRELQL